jgi:hypothetical protein
MFILIWYDTNSPVSVSHPLEFRVCDFYIRELNLAGPQANAINIWASG